MNSEFASKIKNSKKVYKEKPFCVEIDATNFFNNAKSEKILVQGIIDLYFINDYGNIVLIDYKTDYIENGDICSLINKYKTQLQLYKQALELSTGKIVEEIYIYSLYLNEEIKINI